MKIHFWGAARQVTGSMHLLELQDGTNILLDCGLDYEQQRYFLDNPRSAFPFDPASVYCVILSHAHVDHSGNIPNLIRQGFQGKVYCTPPTAELIYPLLKDSAKIQALEYRQSQRKKGIKKPKPLYTEKHIEETMNRLVLLDFHHPFAIREDVQVTLYEAGHILGAAYIYLEILDNHRLKTLAFTGDWGRLHSKLVKDPEPMRNSDVLISESTYGGRIHKKNVDACDELWHHIESTCVKRGGKLIIPAFSVGRTQAIVFAIRQLYVQGKLPDIRVFVDSPLAVTSTRIYSQFPELLNSEAQQHLEKEKSLFHFPNLRMVEDPDQAAELATFRDACIIVSAAGMVEGGRIQEHIRQNIGHPSATILIAGFCAEGTLGHRLLQGQSTIRIKNRDFPVYAQIASTDVFSSHADHDTLKNMILQSVKPGRKVFLVHGDSRQMELLKEDVEKFTDNEIWMPEAGDVYIM